MVVVGREPDVDVVVLLRAGVGADGARGQAEGGDGQDEPLGDALGTARRSDPAGSVISRGFSFPTNPGDGISVEKLDIAAGDVSGNWAASSCAAGFRPGERACP